jgi:ribonuclease HI
VAKTKFYVVWSGRAPGIYTDWPSCKAQVEGVAGAKYKSFATRKLAEAAFTDGPGVAPAGKPSGSTRGGKSSGSPGTLDAAAVDAVRARCKIFTDGGCEPNPGEAGTGVAIYRDGVLAELWFGLYNANGTNNTAELNGLLHGLLCAREALKKDLDVVIFSDSRYAIQCITQWAAGWEKRGWTRPSGEIKNLELIKEIYALYQSLATQLQICHVNGHVGIEGNELADRMSMVAINRQEQDFQRWNETMNIDEILALRAG